MGWDTVNCMDKVFGEGADGALPGRGVALQRLYKSARPNLGRETTGRFAAASAGRGRDWYQRIGPRHTFLEEEEYPFCKHLNEN
jgi:hypothetical protein